jgi:hypothetical protein
MVEKVLTLLLKYNSIHYFTNILYCLRKNHIRGQEPKEHLELVNSQDDR